MQEISLLGDRCGHCLGASQQDLCGAYRAAKPTIDGLLPWIENIPVYGKTIATVIRALEGMADVACPV